jgi:hypothetical protein
MRCSTVSAETFDWSPYDHAILQRHHEPRSVVLTIEVPGGLMGWSDEYACRLFIASHDALSIRVASSPNAFAGQWKASLPRWVKQNIYRGLPLSAADGLLPDGARTTLTGSWEHRIAGEHQTTGFQFAGRFCWVRDGVADHGHRSNSAHRTQSGYIDSAQMVSTGGPDVIRCDSNHGYGSNEDLPAISRRPPIRYEGQSECSHGGYGFSPFCLAGGREERRTGPR